MGDMAGGAIQRHGGNEADVGRVGDSVLLLKTAAAKTANQKQSTANRWNLIRRQGWDVRKQKKENLSEVFTELSLPGSEELVFDLSTQGGGQEVTVEH